MLGDVPDSLSAPLTRDERMPRLYRAVLDGVSELERRGERAVAARFRADARRAYTVWDARAEERMRQILDRLDRQLHGRGRVAMAGRRDSVVAAAPSAGGPASN